MSCDACSSATIGYSVVIVPHSISKPDSQGTRQLSTSVLISPQLYGLDKQLGRDFPAIWNWKDSVGKCRVDAAFYTNVGGISTKLGTVSDVVPVAAWQKQIGDAWHHIVRRKTIVNFCDQAGCSSSSATLFRARLDTVVPGDDAYGRLQNALAAVKSTVALQTLGAPEAFAELSSSVEMLKAAASARNARPTVAFPLKSTPTATDEAAFDQIFSHLLQVPALLRQCGFIIDATVPVTSDLSTANALQCQFNGPDGIVYIGPQLTIDLSTGFAAGGDYNVGGVLQLQTAFANAVLDQVHPTTDGDSIQSSLDALVSSVDASTIASTGAATSIRGEQAVLVTNGMADKFQTVQQTQLQGNATLWNADTVTRGYVVDLADVGTFDVSNACPAPGGPPTPAPSIPPTLSWQPLCVRSERYRTHYGRDFGSVTVEAPLGVHMGTTGGRTQIHDYVFNYRNDSLVAPPTPSPAPGQDSLGIYVELQASGTLPTLRYGHAYVARMRAVDITGYVISNSDAAALTPGPPVAGQGAVSNVLQFGRFAPIVAPIVTGSDGSKEAGNRVDTLVLRRFADGSLEHGSVIRTLTPGSMTLETAIMHGVVQDGAGGVHKSVKDFLHRHGSNKGILFPDSLCRGANLLVSCSYDGRTIGPLGLDFTGWPHVQPLSIVFRALDPNSPLPWTFTASGTEFAIAAQPGIKLDLQLWSYTDVSDDTLRQLALTQCRFHKSPEVHDSVLLALRSKNPCIVTPPRALTALYAVQAPEALVEAAPPRVVRNDVGGMDTLHLQLADFRRNCDQLHVTGSWPAWRSSGEHGFERYDASAPIGTPFSNIPYAQSTPMPDLAFSTVFDAHRRDMTLTVTGRNRWAAYFREPQSTPPLVEIAGYSNMIPVSSVVVGDIIHTLEWSGSPTDPNGAGRTRAAGTIRLVLDSTWYATGDGEELVVILTSTDTQMDPQGIYRASWIGLDPVLASPGSAVLTSSALSASDFSSGFLTTTDLQPHVESINTTNASGANITLTALRFVPRYDNRIKKWCVDFSMEPRFYRPFVALSVSRWQPSVQGVQAISVPVLLPAIQPLPRRQLLVTLGSSGGNWIVKAVVTRNVVANPGHIDVYLDQLAYPDAEHGREDLIWTRSPIQPDQPLDTTTAASMVTVTWTLGFEPIGFRVHVEDGEALMTDLSSTERRPHVTYVDVSRDLRALARDL